MSYHPLRMSSALDGEDVLSFESSGSRSRVWVSKKNRRMLLALLSALGILLAGGGLFSFPDHQIAYLPSLSSTSFSRLPKTGPPKLSPHIHPIAQLTSLASTKWHSLLARQSTTLESCAAEYRRRYNRNPPKGFDLWWAWAVEKHGLKLTDEFDQISLDMDPFWGLSPAQIRSRHDTLLSLGSDRIFGIVIKDGKVSDEPGPAGTNLWPDNKSYYKIFDQFSEILPDMRMAINLHDTPVAFVSWEERQRLIKAGREGVFARDEDEIPLPPEEAIKDGGYPFSFIDLRSACAPDTPGRAYTTDVFGDEFYPNTSLTDLDFRLPDSQGGFIHNVDKQMDICYNPSLRDQHGYFLKSDLYLHGLKRNRLYPMFSWSRFVGSSDITIPTNYRWDNTKNKGGIPWDELVPKVSWRGALTGIWPDETVDAAASQRWRLWSMVQDKFRRFAVLISTGTTFRLSSIRASSGNDEWLDVGPVAFYADVMNETDAGRAALAQFHMVKWLDKNQRNAYKVVLDVDGWGWSARYRELLRTKSAVLKTTVYHQAFTDWLIPWYHYIPISYSYDDLYSVLMYYFGVPEWEGDEQENVQRGHDEELRLIGQRGMEWADEHASWEQISAYTFRVCLEWARLMSDDRDSMDYLG